MTGSSESDSVHYQELSDLLFQTGKIAAAMSVLERSFSLKKINLDPDRNYHIYLSELTETGNWYFERGLEYADAYLYQDAIDSFNCALTMDRDTFETHYCLAGVYKSMEKYPMAEKHCRKSLEMNSKFAPSYILLASLLKLPMHLEECVEACKKAVLIDPNCKAAYYDLACYYSLLAKTEQALAALEMALCKGFSDFEWLLRDPDLSALRVKPEFEFLLQSYRQKNS